MFAPRPLLAAGPSGVPRSGPGCRADHPDRAARVTGDRPRGVHPQSGRGRGRVGHDAGGTPSTRPPYPTTRLTAPSNGRPNRPWRSSSSMWKAPSGPPSSSRRARERGWWSGPWPKARSPAVSFPADPTWSYSTTRSTRSTRRSRTWRRRLEAAHGDLPAYRSRGRVHGPTRPRGRRGPPAGDPHRRSGRHAGDRRSRAGSTVWSCRPRIGL